MLVAPKIITYLKFLSMEEKENFLRFVQSPYFNHSFKNFSKSDFENTLLFIYQFIDKKQNSFDKEKLHYFLYDKQKVFKVATIDILLSNLNQLFKQFLWIEAAISNGDYPKELALLKFFRLNDFTKEFLDLLKKLRINIQQEKIGRQTAYFNFLIEYEAYEFNAFYNRTDTDINLINVVEAIHQLFATYQMEFAVKIQAQKNLVNIEIPKIADKEQIETTLKLITQNKALEKSNITKLIDTYWIAYQTYISTDLDEKGKMYQMLESTLKENINTFHTLDQASLWTIVRNHNIQLFNTTQDKTYLNTAFEFYKIHLEKGILLYNGGLLPATVNSFVRIAIYLKEFEYISNFLKKRPKMVTTDNQDAHYDYHAAQLYFAQGDVKKADDFLRKNTSDTLNALFEDIYIILQVYQLDIKIAFELKDFEFCEFRLKAFRRKVDKDETLTPKSKERFLNFYHILIRLIEINNNPIPNQYDKIKRFIDENKEIQKKMNQIKDWQNKMNIQTIAVAESEWLNEKIEMLKIRLNILE